MGALHNTGSVLYVVATSTKKLPEKKKKAKQTDVSVQPTGKWIERMSQSERAPLLGYVITVVRLFYSHTRFV